MAPMQANEPGIRHDDGDGRVLVVDSAGVVLADSAGPGTVGQSYANRPEIRAALTGRSTQGERHSDDLDADLLFTTAPVALGSRTIGAVRITESVDAVNDEQRSDVIALIGVGVVALLLGVVVAFLLAGSLANPLRSLARIGTPQAGAFVAAEVHRQRGTLGVAAEEAPLRPEDLEEADEVFITSTVREIVPVTRIGDVAVGSGRPGPVTARLHHAFRRVAGGPVGLEAPR